MYIFKSLLLLLGVAATIDAASVAQRDRVSTANSTYLQYHMKNELVFIYLS
jgi:hypothetical protein